MSSELMRRGIAAATALAIAACATDEGPTEPELGSTSAAVANADYAVQDLGTLGGSYSYAFGVSPDGAVVGTSATAGGTDHAFLWRNGTMTDLGTLAGTEGVSAARGINQHGEVVGESSTGDGQSRAFLWREGVMTDLGTLNGDGFGTSAAQSINGLGQVVGYSSSPTATQTATLWQNGAITDLGTLGGSFSAAYDINNSGQVVGSSRVSPESDDHHAFLWQNGVMTDLGTLGGPFSHAQGINEDGDVVGWSEAADGQTHAVVWKQGKIIDLGLFRGQTFGYAINTEHLKVGFWTGNGAGPLLWDGRRERLLPGLGGAHGDATDINDAGLIAGSSYTTDGVPHAALWTPN